jgi:ABC-type sugar transport system ATPase subunit
MDEPTAALSDQETSKLFDNVRGLRNKGKSVIFITHRLSEQVEMSDRITVLRDGKLLGR